MSVKLNGQDLLEVAKLYRPRSGVTKWNKDIIERVITILYSKADAVIALSRKAAINWNLGRLKITRTMLL